MIKCNAQPGVGAMAVIASKCGGYMCRYGTLGHGDAAIVAVFTSVGGFGVIKRGNRRYPTGTYMTSFTHIAGHRMGDRFKGRTADAVMATGLRA